MHTRNEGIFGRRHGQYRTARHRRGGGIHVEGDRHCRPWDLNVRVMNDVTPNEKGLRT